MTREEMVERYGTKHVRFDGVTEQTFVWIDIEVKPKDYPFSYEPPFAFRYGEWQRHGNLISRYVYITKS